MPHMVAFIDVHKRMLAAVAGDAAKDQEVHLLRRKFGAREGDLQVLTDWFKELGVKEVVMESTAQYWETGVADAGTRVSLGVGASAVESWPEGS